MSAGLLGEILCIDQYDRIKDELGDFTAPPTLNDLKVGSTSLNLPSQSNKFRINIYGNEQSPVHWRFLASLQEVNRPVNIPHNNYNARDGGLAANANFVEGLYNGIGFISGMLAFSSAISGNFFQAAAFAFVGMESFQAGAWIRKSESSWNDLIGANDTYPVGIMQVNLFTCGDQLMQLSQSWHEDGLDDYIAQRNALYANPNCWQTINVTKSIANHKISDGLAPQLTTLIDANTCHLEILETNHQEEVHHPEAEEVYDKILRDDVSIRTKCGSAVSSFFKIN